jgi:hypothetical protein
MKMKHSNRAMPRIHKTLTLLVASSTLLAFSQLANAAGTCKEMEKDACMSSTSCSWINSYTTKKGKTVKAYCRNKPKKKSSKLDNKAQVSG